MASSTFASYLRGDPFVPPAGTVRTVVFPLDDSPGPELLGPAGPPMRKGVIETRAAVLQAVVDGARTTREVAADAGVSITCAQEHLKALLGDGEIGGEIRKHSNGRGFVYWPIKKGGKA